MNDAELQKEVKKLRNRLLNWHSKKMKTPAIIDLLESDYQRFRYNVSRRIGKDLNFKDAINQANEDELLLLEDIKNEKRLGI